MSSFRVTASIQTQYIRYRSKLLILSVKPLKLVQFLYEHIYVYICGYSYYGHTLRLLGLDFLCCSTEKSRILSLDVQRRSNEMLNVI